MLCQGLAHRVLARMTGIQVEREVGTALRIAPSATAFCKNKQYSQRYAPSWRHYAMNVAVDDEQRDFEEE